MMLFFGKPAISRVISSLKFRARVQSAVENSVEFVGERREPMREGGKVLSKAETWTIIASGEAPDKCRRENGQVCVNVSASGTLCASERAASACMSPVNVVFCFLHSTRILGTSSGAIEKVFSRDV